MKNAKIAKVLLASSFSVFFIILLLQFVKIGDVMKGLSSLSPSIILLSFVLYLLSYVIRTLRFRLLLPDPPSFTKMLGISALHIFFVTVLPFRLGELSYLYLTKREEAKLGHGLSSLAISRVFDISAVALYFVIAALFVDSLPGIIMQGVILAAIGLGLVVLIVLFSILFMRQAHELLHIIASKLNLYDWRTTDWLVEKTHDLLDGLSMLKRARIFFGGFLLSILLWAVFFITPYIVFGSLGISLPIAVFVLAAAFQALSSALPVQGLLGFGTIEAGWSIAFVAVGIASGTAITASFAYHIIYTVFVLVIGAVAFLLVKK